MRVALVSPYSWTYPGGVTRHIEALAAELLGTGHEFASSPPSTAIPARPPSRTVARARRRARRPTGWSRSAARSAGRPTARSPTSSYGPHAVSTMRRELRAFAPDVVHLHEPVTPVVGWDALSSTDAPLVGTFHCYSESRLPHAIAGMMGARRS